MTTANATLPSYAPRGGKDPFWEQSADRLLAAIGSLAERIGARRWLGAEYLTMAAALIDTHGLEARRSIVYNVGVRPALVQIARLAPAGQDARLEAALANLLRCLIMPATAAGSTLDVQLPAPPDGVLTLPGRPSVRLRLAGEDRSRPLRMRSDGRVLSIAVGSRELGAVERSDGSLRLRPSFAKRAEAVAVVPGTTVAVDGEDEWSGALIAELNRPETFSGNGVREISPVRRPSADLLADLGDSAQALSERWPELAAEINRNILLVHPFRSDKVVGYSHAQHLGTVFLNVGLGDAAFLEERLVHEASHNQLFLMQQERLIPDGADRLLQSPLRKDPRPASGVLHATFVSARCAQWSRRSLDRHPGYAARIEFLESAAREGARTLREDATLTPAGEHLLTDIEQSLEHRP